MILATGGTYKVNGILQHEMIGQSILEGSNHGSTLEKKKPTASVRPQTLGQINGILPLGVSPLRT